MSRTALPLVVFLAGLLAVCWIGAGYIGHNAVGVGVAVVIAACYIAGALELRRYRADTAALAQAVDAAETAPASLADWLQQVPPALRNAVRLRVEGERAALPAPTLTPYLVGLLVLLGMLGTLLGMMATLRGTGLALESATDLHAIRSSLGAPVEGLAVAFGTSIAGVATSAMLGLLSALSRRERLGVVQQLDTRIATTLHVHSQGWQRAETFRLLQTQAALLPTLVERLEAVGTAIEHHSRATGEQLLGSQQRFHDTAGDAQQRLASTMQQALQDGVTQSARAVGEALQPIMAQTLERVAEQTLQLQNSVRDAVQAQLGALDEGFAQSRDAARETWTTALASQQQAHATLADAMRGSLDATAAQWHDAQATQQQTHAALIADLRGTLAALNAAHDARATALIDALAARMDASASGSAQAWKDALSGQQAVNAELASRHEQALLSAAASIDTHARGLLEGLNAAHNSQQDALDARDTQRLATWSDAFTALSTQLGQQWAENGAQVAASQQAVCDTLSATAQDIGAQAQAHARDTIAEISRLVTLASEAPKAAADVVAELRQKLSDSMVRDTAMLEERTHLLGTLETLLDAVNHASTEQRTAVDALVSTSAELLERVGTRFTDHVASETGKLEGVAAQLGTSAVEVASLAEAFGTAMQSFGTASTGLGEQLQQVAGALDASMTRSDEQLAYYVAQAREVVDLSVLSQQQIIEELQQLAGRRRNNNNNATASA